MDKKKTQATRIIVVGADPRCRHEAAVARLVQEAFSEFRDDIEDAIQVWGRKWSLVSEAVEAAEADCRETLKSLGNVSGLEAGFSAVKRDVFGFYRRKIPRRAPLPRKMRNPAA